MSKPTRALFYERLKTVEIVGASMAKQDGAEHVAALYANEAAALRFALAAEPLLRGARASAPISVLLEIDALLATVPWVDE